MNLIRFSSVIVNIQEKKFEAVLSEIYERTIKYFHLKFVRKIRLFIQLAPVVQKPVNLKFKAHFLTACL
jgi:hypothetical protein